MTQNIQNPETQKIIHIYKIIYKIFFTFGSFIIALGIAIGGWYIINTQISHTQASNYKESNQNNMHKETPIITDDINIYAYQNPDIILNENNLQSSRNILQHQGYTLPAHNTTLSLPIITPADTFTQESYNIGMLDKIIQNIIFQNTDTTKEVPEKKLPPIPQKSSTLDYQTNILQSTFNMACLHETWKISNAICMKYINQAVQSMFQYDLSIYHQELINISNTLPTQVHEKFCKNIIHYSRKNKDHSHSLEVIVRNLCSEKQQETYHKNKQLIQANHDIKSQKSINSIGENQIVNEYLIHSLLQNIHNNIQNNTINPIIMKQYIQARNTILEKQYSVGSFTYNASYYLNQTLITPALSDNTLTNHLERSEINEIQENIKQLNNGKTGAHQGIKAYIINQKLINSKHSTTNTELGPSTDHNDHNTILHGTYFQEITRTSNENTQEITIQGELHIPQKTPIPMKVITNFEHAIQAITLPYQTQRIETINTLIQSKKLESLYEIETFIINNIQAIQSDTISVCDILSEYLTNQLTTCTNSQIIIQQEKNNTPLRYQIIINDQMKITKININNTYMRNRIQEDIKNFNTNNSTLVPTIVAIANVTREKDSSDSLDDQIGVIDKFVVIDRIKKYMNREPDNVGQRGDEFVVGITIQDTLFYMLYDIATHSLINIIIPDITINNKKVSVPEFKLTLSDEYTHDINQFINNPIDFIKRRYPSVNVLYQKSD